MTRGIMPGRGEATLLADVQAKCFATHDDNEPCDECGRQRTGCQRDAGRRFAANAQDECCDAKRSQPRVAEKPNGPDAVSASIAAGRENGNKEQNHAVRCQYKQQADV